MQNYIASFVELLATNTNASIVFIVAYLAAIFANGMYGYNFSASDILYGYAIVTGKNIVVHGMNSTLNSPKYEMPEEKK